MMKNAIIFVIGIGVAIFGGVQYGLYQMNKQIDKWDVRYKETVDKVSVFVEVADPKTIRSYVKQLKDLLDDMSRLSSIIETGQLSDEALSKVFKDTQKQVNDINNRISDLDNELKGSVEQVRGWVELQENSLDEFVEKSYSVSDSVRAEIGMTYDKIDDLYKELEQITMLLDNAKNTFFGKFIIK